MNLTENKDFKPATGHRWVHLASILGAVFVVTHLITVIVTCVVEGFAWGTNAWLLDGGGFLAGLFFSFQCRLSATKPAKDFYQGNMWIGIWAVATVAFRVVDTLMLFGLLKWDVIYVTPTGPVLWSNVVSEVFIGMAFALAALIGSLLLLLAPRST